jgi:hypothetical protein
MMARDGPEIVANSAQNMQEIFRPIAPTSAPKKARSVTRHESPVKRSELMTKRTRKPSQKSAKKPPKSPGFFWRKNGAGWDLRRDLYVTSNDGLKKRKQPYVAHLSKEAFGELKRRHKGAALERAIAQWIEEHDR